MCSLFSRPTYLFRALALPLLIAFFAPLTQAKNTDRIKAITDSLLPKEVRVPADMQELLRVYARGTQNYKLEQKDSGKYEWTFVEPDARLFDEQGVLLGRHSAGPVWVLFDSSRVYGKLIAKVPQEGTIPLLLLRTDRIEGEGLVSRIQYIQRLRPRGGAAPTRVRKKDVGTIKKVPYTSVYIFYMKKQESTQK